MRTNISAAFRVVLIIGVATFNAGCGDSALRGEDRRDGALDASSTDLPAGSGGSGGAAHGSGGITGSGGSGAGAGGNGGANGSGGTTGSGGTGGYACSATAPCSSGVCMGTQQGCSGSWTCALTLVACSTVLTDYCACDGMTTFQESSSCPTRAYMFKGPCNLGVSCDTTKVTCEAPTPLCPAGQIPSVVNSCYGPCVPIQFCRCITPQDCPVGHQCRMGSGLCG